MRLSSHACPPGVSRERDKWVREVAHGRRAQRLSSSASASMRRSASRPRPTKDTPALFAARGSSKRSPDSALKTLRWLGHHNPRAETLASPFCFFSKQGAVSVTRASRASTAPAQVDRHQRLVCRRAHRRRAERCAGVTVREAKRLSSGDIERLEKRRFPLEQLILQSRWLALRERLCPAIARPPRSFFGVT